MDNSIVWGNEGGSLSFSDWPLYSGGWIRYSCLEGFAGHWNVDEEANIDSDPLFVVGNSGEYFLSSRLAGQLEDSPCIGTGLGTPSDYGLCETTTRTDGVCDFGIVDMGYHYPGQYPPPRIQCGLNRESFSHGWLIRGDLAVGNEGPELYADVYVVLVRPDGAIESLIQRGFEAGLLPWVSNQWLFNGFVFGPETVFEFEVTSAFEPGSWLYAAALTEPGGLGFVGEASVFPFTVEVE
jgi:hypothetical protein